MQSRLKASRSRVATVVFVPVVLAAMVAPAATAAPVADSGTATGAPQVVSSAQVLSELDVPEDTLAVVDYWTEERMREALPITLPEAPVTGAVTPPVEAGDGLFASEAAPAGHVHHTDYLPTDQLDSHPHASVGKLFLTLNGFDFVCSASAVTTEGRWGPGSGGLVATAGHCVSSGSGQFVSRLMFVPGYDEGAEPFGRWAATNVFTTNAWHLGGGRGYARDVAFARVVGTGEHASARLGDVVDVLDIAFTETYPEDGLDVRVEPAVGNAYASFGYGVESWGGQRPVRSMSPVVALDPNYSPNPQGIDSSHTGGSSGGPWLYNYAPGADEEGLNVINSVNSYVYRGTPVIYGPRFDDQIHSLWTHSNQPAITISDVEVAEGHSGTTAATFTVSLDAAGAEQITVDYATVDGTAEAGSDYTASGGTLTFAPGQTAQQVTVDVIGDTLREDDETFAVLLSGPPNAILRDGRGVGTILDDEPTLSILGATVTEGDAGTTTATLAVSLDAASDLPVTVEWFTEDYTAEAGSDYTASGGTLTFPPGQTSREVTVDVIGDTLDEADEEFDVVLSNPTNAFLSDTFDFGVGTIVADDPALLIGPATVTEGDVGTAAATFPVTLDAASGRRVTIHWATTDDTAEAGSDYTASSGTLTFAPGQTTQHVTVDVTGDVIDEADETFTVDLSYLSNPSVVEASGVGTIIDDDVVPALSIGPATVTEGDEGTTPATFPVSLDAASDLPVTVDWATADSTATAGSDYTTGGGTLTFQPGQTSQEVTVDVIGDIVDEPDETFTVELDNPTNSAITTEIATGTIVDDDVTEPSAGGGTGAPAQHQPEPDGPATGHTGAGGTASGEGERGAASVTTPNAGIVTILVRQADETAPDGFTYLPVAVDITAPGASADNPLVLVFTLDADTLPDGAEAGDIVVFRDGVPLEDCPGATTGGPCVSERGVDSETGDVRLRVLTPAASTWTFGLAQVQPAPEPVEPVRLRGADNVDAAIAWSRHGFDEGGASTVLLGRDDLFADSLASGSVQGVTGAPLLLTPSDSLDDHTADEIERLGARTVVILGGILAVSEHVEAELIGLGYAVERVSGGERLSTATAVAERFFAEATSAIVARAYGDDDDPTRAFADSLGAGAFGAATGQPVLLSDSDGLSAATAAYLTSSSITSVTIIGGAAAISNQVVVDLTALGINVERASGPNRFATAAALAARVGHRQPAGVLLVDGSGAEVWASGFAAASQATTAPLLLTDGPRVPTETLQALAGLSGSQMTCGPYVAARACNQALAAIEPANHHDTAGELR